MSFLNVFKAITIVTVDRERTAIYTTNKQMYLFNTEVLPVDVGEQIYNFITTNRDIYVRGTRTLKTTKGNVEEFRTEYLIQGALEDLKEFFIL